MDPPEKNKNINVSNFAYEDLENTKQYFKTTYNLQTRNEQGEEKQIKRKGEKGEGRRRRRRSRTNHDWKK